jgi:signal transduction histidine kinase
MRLSAFILENLEAILQEWEDFARDLGAVTESMDAQALRDHAQMILEELAEDLETHQSEAQEKAKSKGEAPEPPPEDPDTAAEQHGGLRAHEGFTLEQMVSEYRALRASVVRLWSKNADSAHPAAAEQITRFNEAIDEALADSVKRYDYDLERLMAAARANERMAALGTLSAGLGHDMSNVLVPMRMALDELDRLDHSPEADPIIASLLRSVEHLRGLTQGLRSLSVDSNDPTASTETTDLHVWWAEAISPFKWALGREIQLHAEGMAPSSLPPVQVPKHVLMQAVFNLVQNAAEALVTSGGNIWVSASASEDGTTVHLAVRDDGPGMDQKTLARCTEPFYTTKHRARGTGLGLALVRTAMERHAGHLLIDSKLGQGSTFTLVLPVAGLEQTPATLAKRIIVTVRESRLRATILAILSGLNTETLGAEEAENAIVWIADSSADAQALRLFLAAGGRKARAIVLGDWWSDDAAEPAAGRIIQLDAAPSYTTLQRTLHEVLTGREL